MILVTGANGHLGRAIVNSLLNNGVDPSRIIGLVREEEKAQDLKTKGIQIRVGDYDWYPTLINAFEGVEKLIMVSGRDITSRVEQHENVIIAAKEVGVKHIHYTSFFDSNTNEDSPFEFVSSSIRQTDIFIKESGIPFTLFKNNLYAELLPVMFGQSILQSSIYLPAGNGKASYVTRPDIADAISNVVVQEGHLNRTYNISNVENVSMLDIAGMMSEVLGTEIKYVNPSVVNYIATMEKNSLPTHLIKIFSGLSRAIGSGEFQSPATDLEMLLNRKPVSIMQFLKQTYSKTATII